MLTKLLVVAAAVHGFAPSQRCARRSALRAVPPMPAELTDFGCDETLWKGLPPFSPAISRDDTYEPKPHPAALEAILKTWEIADPAEVVMVGDSPANDVVFGKKAGVATALVECCGAEGT